MVGLLVESALVLALRCGPTQLWMSSDRKMWPLFCQADPRCLRTLSYAGPLLDQRLGPPTPL